MKQTVTAYLAVKMVSMVNYAMKCVAIIVLKTQHMSCASDWMEPVILAAKRSSSVLHARKSVVIFAKISCVMTGQADVVLIVNIVIYMAAGQLFIVGS